MSSDNRTIMEKVKDDFIPSVVSGAIGVLGASFILGVDLSQNLNIFNMQIPAWAAIGGVIAGSDLISYASHDFVLEKIPVLQQSGWMTYENKFLAPILSGAGCYVLFRTTISSDVSLVNSFLLGGGSSIVGRYGYDAYLQANMQK